MIRKIVIISMLFLIVTCPITGLAQNENVSDNLQDEILENLYVDTIFNYPEGIYTSCVTEYKTFDIEQVLELLYSDLKVEDIQIDKEDSENMDIYYEKSQISIGPGVMRFFNNDDIFYIKELISYGEEYEILSESELGFLSKDNAGNQSCSFLDNIGIGTDFSKVDVYSVTSNDLNLLQDSMSKDVQYKVLYDSGKYQLCNFGENIEMYYIKHNFSFQEIPLYGEDSPTLRLMGGIDSPLLAQPMKAESIISEDGFIYITISGVVDTNIEVISECKFLNYDELRKVLIKKFSDVILTDKYIFTDFQLEYIPLINLQDYRQIQLVPVWCCKFSLDSGGEILAHQSFAYRFNAFTGDEIA